MVIVCERFETVASMSTIVVMVAGESAIPCVCDIAVLLRFDRNTGMSATCIF